MSSLHIEPDQLHLTARSFWQAHYQMDDQLYQLRQAYYRLEMAWQGGESDEFLDQLRVLLDRLQEYEEELLSLGLTLSRQAEAWSESDQRWTGIFREANNPFAGE